jgi:hypothetical protein
MLGGKVLGAGALGARAIGMGVGTTMGAGTTKSAIYDATKEELMNVPGMTEERAEKAAQEAQAYGGTISGLANIGGQYFGRQALANQNIASQFGTTPGSQQTAMLQAQMAGF